MSKSFKSLWKRGSKFRGWGCSLLEHQYCAAYIRPSVNPQYHCRGQGVNFKVCKICKRSQDLLNEK